MLHSFAFSVSVVGGNLQLIVTCLLSETGTCAVSGSLQCLELMTLFSTLMHIAAV